MPSPFPGIAPFLEGAMWTTFHFTFGAEIVRRLASRLRARYLVLSVERFVNATFDDIAVTANVYPYTRSPEPALDGAALAIADSVLRMAGLRPA
jgi:Protein of unknown function (DUF4058)